MRAGACSTSRSRSSLRGAVGALYVSLGEVTYWAALALAIPTAGFLMRTFIVFHDCTHGSFLPSRRANLWVGRLSGLLVFQPFANWRHTHAIHHGTAGDLDRRGTGDIPTLTFDEYVASPWRKRLGYRLFRNPLVMFGIGPLWSLIFGPRLWSRSMRPRQRRTWSSPTSSSQYCWARSAGSSAGRSGC